MQFLLLSISIIFSIFSTTVMAYISMATPIGPWIAPTLVLIGSLVIRIFSKNISSDLICAVSAGSIGGILATALGFSFPTIFFLDHVYFASLLASPFSFITIVSGLSFVAAIIAYLFCQRFEMTFLENKQLSFPISTLIYESINAQTNARQALQMVYSTIVTFIFCVLQDGFLMIKSIIPLSVTLIQQAHIAFIELPLIRFDLFPLYWAIGYVGGAVIALPLLIGTVTKFIIVEPLNKQFFSFLTSSDFMLAFASGIVLYTAVAGFWSTSTSFSRIVNISHFKKMPRTQFLLSKKEIAFMLCGLAIAFIYFTYMNFSILPQLYLLIFTLICTYQVVTIAGKIGLAQLGRFATFVMIPAMLIFQLTFLQITLIATFVELCAGIATDIIFSRKVAQLANVPLQKIKNFQLLGIVISALISGVIFYFLIKNLGLGTDRLFAQRAQTRALLVHFEVLNYQVLIVGFVFGWLLKFIKLNPMFVLSGLLMPLNITISLLTGAFIEKLIGKKYNAQPFWSGVFATQSIWIFLRAIL